MYSRTYYEIPHLRIASIVIFDNRIKQLLKVVKNTQRLICRTLHEHNGIVMQKLKEDGSKKRMFNHIKRLMRKQEQRDTSIKFLNGSGIICFAQMVK